MDKCIQPYGDTTTMENSMEVTVKKLKIELLYDSAIQLVRLYPEKSKIQKDRGTLTFIAALFTIARTWEQPKCLSTYE